MIRLKLILHPSELSDDKIVSLVNEWAKTNIQYEVKYHQRHPAVRILSEGYYEVDVMVYTEKKTLMSDVTILRPLSKGYIVRTKGTKNMGVLVDSIQSLSTENLIGECVQVEYKKMCSLYGENQFIAKTK